MTRSGLAELVAGEPDLVVVGTAEHGVCAVELAEREHPDVVLLDLSMPTLDAIRASQQMHRKSPHSRVLVCPPTRMRWWPPPSWRESPAS
jgi:DNA-binding NarL/FixJ family response regulator